MRGLETRVSGTARRGDFRQILHYFRCVVPCVLKLYSEMLRAPGGDFKGKMLLSVSKQVGASPCKTYRPPGETSKVCVPGFTYLPTGSNA